MRRPQQTTKKVNMQGIEKRQRSDFLNRYDFAHASRDTVNRVGKIALEIIKNASSEINNIAWQQINQVISHGVKEIQRVLPNILCGAIDNVY